MHLPPLSSPYRVMLPKLQECLEDATGTADVFVSSASQLKVLYVTYCMGKRQSEDIIGDFSDALKVSYTIEETKWEIWTEWKREVGERSVYMCVFPFQELSSQLKDRLTLRDYLIKPIQRITKYNLFLKNLRKYSVRAGTPLPNLEVCVAIVVCF